jgi:hypothetical protein
MTASPGPQRVVADVFVVGGAAMALDYDASQVTRDVDARFLPHGIVLEEARRVAADLGLPPWWFNEQATCTSPVRMTSARLRPSRTARHGGLTAAHLRDEGTGRQSP